MWLKLSRAVIAIALAALHSSAQAPDAREIIKRSVDRDFYDFEKVKDYTYVEYEVDREYDAKGNLKKTETETDEMLILGGRPYEKVIAKDDKPLDEKKARKEQEEMDKEAAKRAHMSVGDKAKLEKERAEERAYLREIPDAFDFRITGTEEISGKPAWVMEATPRAGYKVKDSKAKILTKIRGRIWIDQAEYRWVKMEAEAIDGLSFGLGLFKIEPGGMFRFEQARVNDEVWLPSHIFIRGEGRLAYVKKVRAEVEVTYRDYRKFQTDSKILPVEDK
jgi:hypothetical protein